MKDTNKFIRVSQKTKNSLKKLKLYSRESYDEIINRIIEHLNGDGKLNDND